MTVIALGPGDPALLTVEALQRMKKAGRLILRTGKHAAAGYLRDCSVPFETLDLFYDEADDFDQLNRMIVQYLCGLEAETEDLYYAVPFPSTDETVRGLSAEGLALTVYPGVDYTGVYMAKALQTGLRVGGGIRAVTASDLAMLGPDPSCPLLISEINSRIHAGEIKLKLLEIYPDNWKVLLGDRVIPLSELDRQERYDHTSCVLVPAGGMDERERFVLRDLVDIMARLRDPWDGCPWDREQTHASLKRYLVEEAYEVLDTIDSEDSERMADELGDVLFQIVFHAQIGKEFGEFTLEDVITAICRKMIHRHPHIFPDKRSGETMKEAPDWEKLKAQEKHLTSRASVLEDLPRTFPALLRAAKAADKIRGWEPGTEEILSTDALTEMITRAQETPGPERETLIGRALFTLAAISARLGVMPESTLNQTVDEVISRYRAGEESNADGKPGSGPAGTSLDEWRDKE